MEKLAHSGIPKRADLIRSIAQISDSSLCPKKKVCVLGVRANKLVKIVNLLNLIGSQI